MARIFQSGFELNSITSGVEWDIMGAGNTADIVTSPVRTGTYAGRINGLTSGTDSGFNIQFAGAAGNGPYFTRFYLNITTLPTADNTIFRLTNTAFGSAELQVRLTSTGALKLMVRVSAVQTQVGSTSSVLNTGQQYRIEVKFDKTGAAGAHIAELQIDGAVAATSSTLTIDAGVLGLTVGGNMQGEVQTQALWYFDDVALNDSTGSFQTGYPGAGQIIHLRPNAAGDNNAFTVQVGGTAGSANNFTRVNEVTPDDATTYNGDVTATDTDDFNIDNTPASIGASDTINVVMVGVRFRALVAAAEAAFKVRVKKAAAGTVTSSAAIIPNSTNWVSNAIAVPIIYPLITYQDPDSGSWTKATLDTAQIGYNISTTNTNAADITAVWMSVDSTPVVVTTKNVTFKTLLGAGQI